MMHPFLTLDDETEIIHSDMLPDGRVKVYFERPDAKACFLDATCFLPSYEWESVHGFSEDDVARFQDILESCAHLIIEFSQTGGLDSASGFLDWRMVGFLLVERARPARTYPCSYRQRQAAGKRDQGLDHQVRQVPSLQQQLPHPRTRCSATSCASSKR